MHEIARDSSLRQRSAMTLGRGREGRKYSRIRWRNEDKLALHLPIT